MNKFVKFIIKFLLFWILLFVIYAILMGVWAGIFSPENITRPPAILTILSLFISWFVVFKKKIIDRFLEKKS